MNLSLKKSVQTLFTIFAIAAVCIVYARNVPFSENPFFAPDTEDTLSTEDSIRLAKEKADSLANYRSYIKSKRYNDSVDAWRKHRMDSIRAANDRKLDSIKAERQRVMDSANLARQKKNDSLQEYIASKQLEQQRYIDSLNTIRKNMTDSMNRIKKYRNSRKYKDSVKTVQKARIDSIKAERQAYMDSITVIRQQAMDSLMAVRQQQMDSMTAYLDSVKEVREHMIDSMKTALQNRLDSLEKVKEARQEELYQKEDDRLAEERRKKLEKLQEERDAYTNEKLLSKKWTFMRQILQNTTTRYNYYFNAKNKMREAEDNMFRSKTDDLDSLISLFPFDPNVDSMKMKADMDSLVQRISVGIQIHDPRVKWQDDLYLILGKSYFYKGDYINAAAAFQYIVSMAIQEEKKLQLKENKKNKKPEKIELVSVEETGWLKHKPVKNDAIIWLARVYIQQGEYTKAQTLLDMVNSSKNLSPRLKGELEECYARYYLSQGLHEQALPYLDSMSFRKNLDPQQRYRSAFLAGQIYQSQRAFDDADRLYAQVIQLHPPIEFDFKASINQLIAKSGLESGNIEQTIKTFKGLTKEQKYRNYFDQIYYELARLQHEAHRDEEALENYRTSTSFANNNPRQKGLSFYEMGNIYYEQKNYLEAQTAYDSALMFLTPNDQPQQNIAIKMNTGLAQVAVPGNKVKLIDSLLTLSSLSEKEKREWAKAELKRKKEEKRWQELQANMPSGPQLNKAGPGDWYFANETVASKGELDFKTKWGNRTLKDNWRRSIAGFGDNDFASEFEVEEKEEELTEQDLLALIPSDPRVIDSLKRELEGAYYDLGMAFVRAEDDINASATFETLLSKYPGFSPKEEVLYQQYLLALRANKANSAEQIKNEILNKYAQTEVAENLKASSQNMQSGDAGQNKITIDEHLDETYRMLKLGMFKDVLVRSEEVRTLYPIESPHYMNKYGLMKAIATAGNGDYAKADSMLTNIIKIKSNDSLTNWAQDVQNYIRSNMPFLNAEEQGEAGSTSFLGPEILNKEFEYVPSSTHYILVYTRKYDGRFKGLRAGINDFNSLNHSDKELKTDFTEMNDNEAFFIIKEFDNAGKSKSFLNTLKKESQLLKEYALPSDVTYMLISEDNYKILILNKKVPDYLSFYYKNYR